MYIRTQKHSKNMASAFYAPCTTRWDDEEAIATKAGSFSPTSVGQNHSHKLYKEGHACDDEHDMSETEDEEVKMNCIGGVHVYTTSSDEDDFDGDDDEESCCSEESRGDASERGVVTFVARQILQAPEMYCPKALLGGIMEDDDRSGVSANSSATSDIDEVDSDDDDSDLSDDESSDAGDEENDFGDDSTEGDADVEEIEFSDRVKPDDDASSACSQASQVEFTSNHQRLDSPTLSEACSLSQGTPEVCDEEERMKEILHEFGVDDTQCLTIMDKVLGLQHNSSTSKRILSSLSEDDVQDCAHFDTPKRMRCSIPTQRTSPGLTSFDLGPSAFYTLEESTHRDLTVSPFSEQEAEHDRALGEELAQAEDGASVRESTPVPLLSPPPSPLCVESDKGQLTTMCEWPCNLAVDCALLVTGMRSHSPVSLAMMDEQPFTSYYYGYDAGTSLTPLLRGIRVNLE
ncbi:hypothetical protein MHU86_23954 [Fragilaria crotonensis]|nr:hypothetical protein MHU86_23954 [Fragilaria crotonensis]